MKNENNLLLCANEVMTPGKLQIKMCMYFKRWNNEQKPYLWLLSISTRIETDIEFALVFSTDQHLRHNVGMHT